MSWCVIPATDRSVVPMMERDFANLLGNTTRRSAPVRVAAAIISERMRQEERAAFGLFRLILRQLRSETSDRLIVWNPVHGVLHVKFSVPRDAFEITKFSSRDKQLVPEIGLVHSSDTIGYVLRCINTASQPQLTTNSIVHPGIFVSIVLNGSAEAGPIGGGMIAQYRDRSLVAIAVSESTNWISHSLGTGVMRGVGIAFPLASVAKLGLSQTFATLFDGEPVRAIRVPARPRVQAVADEILSLRSGDELDRVLLDAYAVELLVDAFKSFGRPRIRISQPGIRERLLIGRDLIEADIARDWTIEELAGHAGLGAKTFSTHFKQEFGTSVIEFLRNRRLEQAREALLHQNVSVTDAAFLAGYRSPANFATAFRRRFGHSPRATRADCNHKTL